MLIFTDVVPLEIGIKKIYIYIYIFIFIFIYIYIGHLFVKHDLALLCVDTRGRNKQRKRVEERIKEYLFLPHRGLSTHNCAQMHKRTDTRIYTHRHTHKCHGFYCSH